jgi:hypothetical protein
MFRVLTALVLVSACSPAGVVQNEGARHAGTRTAPERSESTAAAPTREKASARRLAPPFGGSSGVRRVSVSGPSEATPTVVAAIDRRD